MIKELNHNDLMWIEKTLASISIREKIGQTVVEHVARMQLDDFSDNKVSGYLSDYPVGGIFLAGELIKGEAGSADLYQNTIKNFHRFSRLPLLAAGDLEHGAGSAVPSLTVLPNMMAVGAANSGKLAYDFGKYTAEEGVGIGFNWTFSPVMDVLLNWQNPVMSTRTLGSNPDNVARLGTQIIKGLQENGMAACAKHFPGDGVDFRDQHICTSVNSLSEEEWWICHGKVFQEAINAGVYTIMLGHIALPWLDGYCREKRRYRPATLSKRIVDLLRKRMGFEGVIISDALDMGGFVGWDCYEKRMIECFNSGADAVLWPGKAYFAVMEEAVRSGEVKTERLNESVARILGLKIRLGLIDTKTDIAGYGAANGGDCPDHGRQTLLEAGKTSVEIAARSITLVRNRRNLLPLDPKKVKKVLLGKMTRITKDKEFSIDGFLERFKDRGIEVEILDDWKPGGMESVLDESGLDYDAFIMPFILNPHGLMNTIRPVGESAMAIWCSQMLSGMDPIVISMSSPFLLYDLPYIDTLVNTYSAGPVSLDMLFRALFGELPFGSFSPVDTGGL